MGKDILTALDGKRVVVTGGKKAAKGSKGTITYVSWSGHNLMVDVKLDTGAVISIIHYNVELDTDKLVEVDQ